MQNCHLKIEVAICDFKKVLKIWQKHLTQQNICSIIITNLYRMWAKKKATHCVQSLPLVNLTTKPLMNNKMCGFCVANMVIFFPFRFTKTQAELALIRYHMILEIYLHIYQCKLWYLNQYVPSRDFLMNNVWTTEIHTLN